jgi:hypothetical protein
MVAEDAIFIGDYSQDKLTNVIGMFNHPHATEHAGNWPGCCIVTLLAICCIDIAIALLYS